LQNKGIILVLFYQLVNNMILIKDVMNALEGWAPPTWQESYDNSGLIIGDPNAPVTGVLTTLDCTEPVIDEALAKGCNLVIAHHPIVFSGMKKITGANYIERTVIKAIKNDIAIYAIHTNLDNLAQGVNGYWAQKLGLQIDKVLIPMSNLYYKLATYVPLTHADAVRQALSHAGAGKMGKYDECSFSTLGKGSFRAGVGAQPFVGTKGTTHFEEEVKLEVLLPKHLSKQVITALLAAHPYETVAYDLLPIANNDPQTGAGLIAHFKEPIPIEEFLSHLKSVLAVPMIKHTQIISPMVQKIALCGGAGSFVLPFAMAQKADVLVTADFKYHQFFDADGKILIADVGHFESEQFTPQLILEYLSKKFTTFATRLAETNTNPVFYF
jgi:dinuclear metal center YbgI/SA1388 family protein